MLTYRKQITESHIRQMGDKWETILKRDTSSKLEDLYLNFYTKQRYAHQDHQK